MSQSNHTAPDAALFEAIVQAAINALPEQFRGAARAVAIFVEDFAPEVMLADMEIEDPYSLTGLYDGVPMTEKSVMDQPTQPDAIWLFRRPILDEWIERGDVTLSRLVTHIYVHELAHHFGWSDADIAAIDEWWT